MGNAKKYAFKTVYEMAFVFDILIREPIRLLIMKGPTWIGGFAGQTNAQICALLTKTETVLWEVNFDACQDQINRYIDSYEVLFIVVLYIISFYWVINCVCSYWLWRPQTQLYIMPSNGGLIKH